VRVKVTDADAYDLWGEVLGQPPIA
jgi:hypothetical protein